MTRKDLGTIGLGEWQHEKMRWRRQVQKMKRESPGKLLCIHNYQGLKNCDTPTGLTAEVIFPHGTARVWVGKTKWVICVKCGRMRLSYDDYGGYPY